MARKGHDARSGEFRDVVAMEQEETKSNSNADDPTKHGTTNGTQSANNYGSVGSVANPTMKTTGVQGNGWFVSMVYVFLGIGVWLPWNAFTAAKTYFQTRMCGIFDNVELWFVLAMNLSYTAVTMFLLFGGQADKKQQEQEPQRSSPFSSLQGGEKVDDKTSRPHDDQHATAEGFAPGYCDVDNESTLSPHCSGTMTESTATRRTQQDNDDDDDVNGYRMVMAPFSSFLLLFCVTGALVLCTKVSGFTFLTISSIAASGIATAIGIIGVLTTAAIYPRGIGINSFSSGEAAGGVLISTANFIAVWMYPPAELSSSSQGGTTERDDNDGDDAAFCVPYRIDWGAFAYFVVACTGYVLCLVTFHILHRSPLRQHYRELHLQRQEKTKDEEEALLLGKNDDHTPATVASVWRKVGVLVMVIAGIPIASLPVCPAWTSLMRSKNEAWNVLFVPLTFVLYNVGDLTGRLSSTLFISSITSRQIVVICVLRLVLFWPAFMFGVRTSVTKTEGWFEGDAFAIILLLTFGFTMGLLFSLVFGHYPTLLSGPEELEIASSLITLGLGFGLVLGSSGSFAYVEVAKLLGV